MSGELPDPPEVAPSRCRVHGCYRIITTVSEEEWVPEAVCPICHPESILPGGRFERYLQLSRARTEARAQDHELRDSSSGIIID